MTIFDPGIFLWSTIPRVGLSIDQHPELALFTRPCRPGSTLHAKERLSVSRCSGAQPKREPTRRDFVLYMLL